MSLRKKIGAVVATGAIAIGMMLAAPIAASATGDPNALDKGDFTQACKSQHPNNAAGWVAQLKGSTAYSWKCVYVPGSKPDTGVDINAYCMQVWGVWAMTTNPSSPYSWRCQV